jgi:hypothetical protein
MDKNAKIKYDLFVALALQEIRDSLCTAFALFLE